MTLNWDQIAIGRAFEELIKDQKAMKEQLEKNIKLTEEIFAKLNRTGY